MKTLTYILFSFLLLSCVNNPNQTANSDQNEISYVTHIDKENGFSVEYPKGWEKIDTVLQPYILIVRENLPDSNDLFNEGMNITKLSDEGLTLEQLADENIKMIQQYRPDFKVGKRAFKTKKGINAFLLKAEFTEQELKLVSMSVLFKNDTNLFTLTQSVEAQKVDDYKDSFGRMINSFEWIEK